MKLIILLCDLILLTVSQLCFLGFVFSQFDYPTAKLSTTWTNNVSAPNSLSFADGSTVRGILLRGTSGPRYAFGFFCNGNCDKFIFAVFIVQSNSAGIIVQHTIGFPQVVWSANRDYTVSLNSTLQLTSDGDLILKDVDGVTAWSTNTSGKSVIGLNMTETGNLVLYNSLNETVWQSFDHPTDVLVPGQKLFETQALTSSISNTNWNRGVFKLSVSSNGLFAFIQADPPQEYFHSSISGNRKTRGPSYVKFVNGSLSMYFLEDEPSDPDQTLEVPLALSAQYMKLEGDGHLRVYEWGKGTSGGWGSVFDLLTEIIGKCNYPMVCGKYGVCSDGQCSCPAGSNNETRFFKLVNNRQPALGCAETSPLSCGLSQYHEFLELTDVTYFHHISDISSTDMETCKEACLQNCSCKAALFRYGSNSTEGDCYLPSHVFSLINIEKESTYYNSTAFLKIQGRPPTPPTVSSPIGNRNSRKVVIIGASLGAFVGLLLIAGLIFLVISRKGKDDIDEEECLEQVPGMPKRFSYEELKIATDDFVKKLGEGGFGSVFHGILSDGMQIAVKLLDGVGHIKQSFLAEVETIGNIHHINLVKLVGFCAEKCHRALVYEYMPNGSLEKWIFKPNERTLDWIQRKKIILDIGKGLSYLHEDCRQKIMHLDIKPQNILLDESFNAKVSDFGLSKLIDKEESNVMTTMRGTPGYMAPEWLNSVITEKVDVYSFGVVVLEILCGRKNLDRSQAEEEVHLLSLFKSKGEKNLLFDLVDKCSQDMQVHKEEVVEMMRISAWCLQSDFTKRPSMSVVVKVLEGVMEVDKSINYALMGHTAQLQTTTKHGTSTAQLPSVLSGPR